jgi:hypothetical protein
MNEETNEKKILDHLLHFKIDEIKRLLKKK